jgi:hypothetical protein
MMERSASGPSGTAEWERRTTGAASSPLSVLLLPDAADASVWYALLGRPLVWRRSQADPTFTLTLILKRRPRPDEVNLAPLINGGVLAMDVSLAPPAAALADLSRTLGADVRRLFARDTLMTLRPAGQPTLVFATARATGPGMRTALSVTLERDDALDVLRALDGTPSRLRLQSEVTFRVAAGEPLRVAGTLADVHAFLRERCDETGVISLADLRAAFSGLIDARVLARPRAGPPGPNTPDASGPLTPADVSALFGEFVRSAALLLERLSGDRFRLRPQPPGGVMLELEHGGGAGVDGGMRTVRLDGTLDQVIGGALDGLDRSRFIHLVCPDPGGGLSPVPTRSWSGGTRGVPEDDGFRLSAAGGDVQSFALTMRPSAASPTASALLAGDLARVPAAAALAPGRVPGLNQWWVDDLMIRPPMGEPLLRLPVVEDAGAPIWRDRVSANTYWYAPAIEVVRPAPNAVPDASPFAFTYRRIGATADGGAALTGTVRFTLRTRMGDATAAALRAVAGATGRPVPMNGLSVALAIPYVDRESGQPRQSVVQAKVTAAGDVLTATIDLLNDAVRLAYGALAVPGFQAEPPRLLVAYTFGCYVPLARRKVEVLAAGKTSVTAIARTAEESLALAARPHLDALTATIHYGAAEVRLTREAPALAPPAARSSSATPEAPAFSAAEHPALAGSGALAGAAGTTRDATGASGADAVVRASATGALVAGPAVTRPPAIPARTPGTRGPGGLPPLDVAIAPIRPPIARPPVVVPRPPITNSDAVAEFIRKSQYATRTLVRQDRLDVSFPCEQLGAFYRQEGAAGAEAVGCVDALRLGQAVVRQYAEMPALAAPEYRVFRSLQQPGRFLVLPAAYRITRFDNSVEPAKAYRPAVAVYSYIDLEDPGKNRVIYHATLQPDVPPHARRALQERLAAEARTPIVEYPTDVAAELEYAWTIGAGIGVETKVVREPGAFQITLATDLGGALVLRNLVQTAGVFGSARLKLPDGTALETALAIDLNAITGPWSSGPVEVALAPGKARLTNRIERPVDVSDVSVFHDGKGLTRVPVEASVAPGATIEVPIAGSPAEAYAVYTIPPGAPAVLEEIRSFVEEIHTNVIFVDLINYAEHDLARLQIDAQMKSVPGTRTVPMQGVPPSGSLDFLLPLTTYLASRTLEFRVTKTYRTPGPPASPRAETTAWLSWDLATQGNVVSLTWDMIAPRLPA